MSKYALIKNGNRVVARAQTAAAMRVKALELIARSPRSSFEAVKVVRRVKSVESPPTWDVVEEDVT